MSTPARRLTGAGVLLLAAVTLTAPVLPRVWERPGPASPLTGTAGAGIVPATGKPPLHCLYSGHSISSLEATGAWLGVPVSCAVVFANTAGDWASWKRPWILGNGNPDQAWAAWARGADGQRRLVISISLVPVQVTADASWRQRGATGAYAGHARELAANLVAAGLGNAIIRIAAEANGTWNHDHAGDDTAGQRAWARTWAHAAAAMRSVRGADFAFDWTVAAGNRPLPLEHYYPGDEAVDIIGIDVYDELTGSAASGQTRWRQQAERPGGLDAVAGFAARHAKPLSIPEAGLMSPAHGGAGDNPAFVTSLRDYLATREWAYAGYFDKNVAGTLRLRDVPEAADQWRRWVTQAAAGDRG